MTQRRVLIIDDDPELLKLVAIVFKRAGYEAYVAKSGAEGLTKVDTINPDLVILDVLMPVLDGIGVLKQIRANPRTAHVPIIVLSALGKEEHKLNGFAAGADDYVPKPVGPKELLARSKALLRRASYVRGPAARVITVLGAKGGVGTTTVALNLAAALARRDQSVILAELRPHRGSLQHNLNMMISQDLGKILAEDPKQLDQDKVSRAVVLHPSGFRLLIAAQNPTGHVLSATRIDAILRDLTDKSQYLVLDLAPLADDGTRRALERSDLILLVTEPEHVSIMCAEAELASMREWGVSDRVVVVTSARAPSASLKTRDDVESRLGVSVIAMVPPAPEVFHDASRSGEPVATAKWQSLPGKVFADLAEWLIKQIPAPAVDRAA